MEIAARKKALLEGLFHGCFTRTRRSSCCESSGQGGRSGLSNCEAARRPGCLAKERSGTIASITIDLVVPDHHVIADLDLRRIALRDRGVLAVLELHHDLPAVVTVAGAFADRVTGETTAHGAGNRRRGLALAFADLVTQQAADHRSDHGTDRGTVAVAELDLADVTDIATTLIALAAAPVISAGRRCPVTRTGVVRGAATCHQQRGRDDADQRGERLRDPAASNE